MKSTKTVLAVAIVIVGFSYAVGAEHPSARRCCGPQPEDIRSYYFDCPNCELGSHLISPKVEGSNGFVITDFVVGMRHIVKTQTESN